MLSVRSMGRHIAASTKLRNAALNISNKPNHVILFGAHMSPYSDRKIEFVLCALTSVAHSTLSALLKCIFHFPVLSSNLIMPRNKLLQFSSLNMQYKIYDEPTPMKWGRVSSVRCVPCCVHTICVYSHFIIIRRIHSSPTVAIRGRVFIRWVKPTLMSLFRNFIRIFEIIFAFHFRGKLENHWMIVNFQYARGDFGHWFLRQFVRSVKYLK